MNLLSDRSENRSGIFTSRSLRLISPVSNDTRRKLATKLAVLVGIVAAFIAGFALSVYLRPGNIVVEPKIQIADFRVDLPEGDTTLVISSREAAGTELGRLQIKREGNRITGVPGAVRQIAARQTLSDEDAAFFRRELSGVYLASDTPWEKANKIRIWLVRQPHRLTMPGLNSRVPREAYEQMKSGQPVLCGNLADIYTALCEASGITARAVGLSVAVQNGLFGIDTHAGTEVWLPDLGGWIYQDPTFDCYWLVDGKPASALTLHDAIMSGSQLEFAPRERAVEQRLRDYYIDPRLYFRHISYEYKPGGTVLYFADERLEPLSLNDKNWIHTDKRADIQRLDNGGNLVKEQRAQILPGIFVQVLGQHLFVRDRRERSQGIRVRSSSGTVEGCAYLHQRAQDMGLFNAINLARNPSFRLTRGSNQLADDWAVTGPVEAMTISGGQAMAALAGGRLWQRIKVQPYGRYLLYARVSVSRGIVNWSLADSTRKAMSMGSVEPERISEVVSDVVESESGFIDVNFDVPSGGSFRVMDVIVAAAPRFSDGSAIVATDPGRRIASLPSNVR